MTVLIDKYTTRFNTISARILDTSINYNLINTICTFDDPEFNDILFMKSENKSLHFGDIYSIDKSTRAKKEFWTIRTSKGIFKLQILSKPDWHFVKEVKPQKGKVINLESRAFIKRFFASFNIDNLFKNKFNNNIVVDSHIEKSAFSNKIIPIYSN